MKRKSAKVFAIVAIVVLGIVAVCDGMMNWFGLGQGMQYAYNICFFCLLPGLISLTGYVEWAMDGRRADDVD